MAESRSRVAWGHTSSILCLIANVNRDPRKSRPFTPDQFNPHRAPKRRKGKSITVDQLAEDIMSLAGGRKGGGR
jgi:cytochrome P450